METETISLSWLKCLTPHLDVSTRQHTASHQFEGESSAVWSYQNYSCTKCTNSTWSMQCPQKICNQSCINHTRWQKPPPYVPKCYVKFSSMDMYNSMFSVLCFCHGSVALRLLTVCLYIVFGLSAHSLSILIFRILILSTVMSLLQV